MYANKHEFLSGSRFTVRSDAPMALRDAARLRGDRIKQKRAMQRSESAATTSEQPSH
jgi:hypothetical protein